MLFMYLQRNPTRNCHFCTWQMMLSKIAERKEKNLIEILDLCYVTHIDMPLSKCVVVFILMYVDRYMHAEDMLKRPIQLHEYFYYRCAKVKC